MTDKRKWGEIKEIWTIPCIPGYRVMYKGTEVATVKRNGDVMWDHDLSKVSSAHPYGKSYVDLLPESVLRSINKFSDNIIKEVQ